jgi:hypothetical protein
MPKLTYALSLKQPWAALVVHGLKTVEIRRWPTRHRGILLIHASQQWDDRAAADSLPPEVQATAELRGGIIGQVELVELKTYRTPEAFAADETVHWNRPEWYQPPAMFGFRFSAAKTLPFRRCKGQVRLFSIPTDS